LRQQQQAVGLRPRSLMARTYIVGAASTRRRRVLSLRTVMAFAAIGVLGVSGSALLATRGSAPAGITTALQATASPVATTPEPQLAPGDGVPTAAVPDLPPPHGVAPPGRCLNTSDGVSLAKVVRHGSRSAKVVALTFDDGWNKANVLKIVSILEQAKVNATFFPTGQAIKQEPATWRAVALAGFPIANHTYDHKDLKGMCEATQHRELDRQDAMVAKELGLTPLPYMRPPYGDYDTETRLAAASDGEQALVLWDVDTRDWTGISSRTVAARALAGTNGSIIIMHTSATNMVSALPRIIARYRARGFGFVTIGQLLGIDGPTPFP
jgi:peptidoglycan/xylan/chitin deacetylase (PgdA/CDA1 family)